MRLDLFFFVFLAAILQVATGEKNPTSILSVHYEEHGTAWFLEQWSDVCRVHAGMFASTSLCCVCSRATPEATFSCSRGHTWQTLAERSRFVLTESNTLHFGVERAEAACVKTPSHIPTQSSNKEDTGVVLIRHPCRLMLDVHETLAAKQ